MKKKKNTNKEIYLNNVYAWGGDFANPKKLKGVLAGSLGSVAGSVLNTTIGGGMTDTTGGKIGSGISNIGGKVGDAISTVNPLIGGIVSAASGLVGGLVSRTTGADFNEEAIADIENQNRQMFNTVIASGSNSDIMSQWANQEWGDNFTKSDLGKEGWFSNAVRDKYNALQKAQQEAQNRVLASYDNAIENTEKQSTLNMLANYSALGGPIHINPSKKGTFTAAASRHNMGVQEFARKVLANKDNYSTSMVKKANFARNAAKWKHAEGGPLETDWDNTFIGKFINHSENADSIGWDPKTQTWHTVNIKGFDPKNIGMGVDIDNLTPEERKKLKKDKNGEGYYISAKDERELRYKKLNAAEESYNRRLKYARTKTNKDTTPSEVKKAVTMSAIYNLGAGNVANKVFENTEVLKALTGGTDAVYTNLIHQYYDPKSPNVIKKRSERIDQERKFLNMKAEGGFLTHGGIFDNGVTIIGNGDSHENNPYEGVQMGVDPNGIPNLVEENEVVWNDYVFSDRLKANKEIRSKYKLRGNKEMSFADIAKKLSKESEERPNDPISKRGLDANLIQLAMEQEVLKMKKDKKTKGNKFEYGGFPTSIDNIWKPFEAPEVSTYEDIPHTIKKDDEKSNITPYASYLRYAPLVGSIAGIAQNIFSKPDYSAADRLNKAAADLSTAPRIGHTPIGDYMSYTPVDTNVLTNKLSVESTGLRNALRNSSSPSRTAALLAADYNAQNALGDAYLKAAEQNLARKQAVATFNRGTNQANAEMGLKAAMTNAELAQKAKQLGFSATLSLIQARDAVDNARNTALNTNINQLMTSLGNIGREQALVDMISKMNLKDAKSKEILGLFSLFGR